MEKNFIYKKKKKKNKNTQNPSLLNTYKPTKRTPNSYNVFCL